MLPTAYSPESLIPFPFESMKTLPDRQHNSPTDPPKFVGAMVAISGDNPAPEAPPDVAAAELSCGVVKVAIAVDVVVGTWGLSASGRKKRETAIEAEWEWTP